MLAVQDLIGALGFGSAAVIGIVPCVHCLRSASLFCVFLPAYLSVYLSIYLPISIYAMYVYVSMCLSVYLQSPDVCVSVPNLADYLLTHHKYTPRQSQAHKQSLHKNRETLYQRDPYATTTQTELAFTVMFV